MPDEQYPSIYPTHSSIGFRCPFCQSPSGVFNSGQISTSGWVVFFGLLLFCFPLCLFVPFARPGGLGRGGESSLQLFHQLTVLLDNYPAFH